ncbi:hypothetical protein BP5796_09662 [Coleophoma crateriformis]|uniref:Acyltransferase 3 domain-containing protein n=1 Tax=Coleophoma crateriformis TaxID=565419 RepID=A0A3D8QYL0_9HELO|nr:hypothetical protein BP5796_09662 [Coleophoma crateriformis]
MSARHETILESGEWDSGKQDGILSASKAHNAAQWCMETIRPSVLTRVGPKRQIRRTAYLDGLRGFAAFLVYWQHHQLWPRPGGDAIFENAFGYQNKYYFACLPIIRTFFTGGHFAVAVFFIISGYVLSTKPLTLIHSGEYSKLGDNLASALFRRWLRLHLPVIVVSFLYMTTWHAFGIWTVAPEHKLTYSEEVWNFYLEFKNFSFAFRQGGEAWFTYNFPTWSIPVEFRGSIIVYTALLAFSRCTKNARLLGQLVLIFYFMYIVDGWYGAMFITGMLLCELDILARTNELPRFIARLEPHKTTIFYSLFVISAFLSGVPSHTNNIEVLRESPGWYYLSFLKSQAVWDLKWFYLFWAALFLVVSIPRIGWLRAFFENRFNQYLGRISFALYLVHGPVLWTVGDRLYTAAGWHRDSHLTFLPGWVDIFLLSKEGPLGFEMSFLLPHLVILPLTFWLAEVATKLIDEPSVRFSQWLYERILPQQSQ